MERTEFAQLALAQLKKARPGDTFVVDDEKFQIVMTRADGKSSISALHNYYDEYLHAPPAERQAVLDRITRVGRLVESNEALDEVRVMLVPRIRPRRYFEIDTIAMASQLVGEGGVAPKVPYYRPLAEHLGVGLAIDRPEHIEYVTNADRFKVPAEELGSIALANLKRMTKTGLQSVGRGVWMGHWGDEYAAERMLMPELFTALGVSGDPVVFLPGAERIYVAGSDDPDALAVVMKLVDERLKAPRGLLRYGFLLRGGTFQLFEPKTALGRELSARLSEHLADAYAAQKPKLQESYEDGEDAPFVATVMLVGTPDGSLKLTVATWTEDVHTLLPRTQVVSFMIEGDFVMVPWGAVMELAGAHLAQVPDLYPPRWETSGFPDAPTLAKLRAQAISMPPKGAPAAPATAMQPLPMLQPPGPGARPNQSKAIMRIVVVATIAAGIVYLLRHL